MLELADEFLLYRENLKHFWFIRSIIPTKYFELFRIFIDQSFYAVMNNNSATNVIDEDDVIHWVYTGIDDYIFDFDVLCRMTTAQLFFGH